MKGKRYFSCCVEVNCAEVRVSEVIIIPVSQYFPEAYYTIMSTRVQEHTHTHTPIRSTSVPACEHTHTHTHTWYLPLHSPMKATHPVLQGKIRLSSPGL